MGVTADVKEGLRDALGAIHLVRHGQASFGSDNYDALSVRGHEQARALGYAWEAAGWLPTHAVSGSMQRHHETALGALSAAGQDEGYDVDGGWNEFDHESVLRAFHEGETPTDPREFQAAFATATGRWTGGEANEECAETFTEFSDRVLGAFERAVASNGKGEDTAVFTSGGVVAVVASHLVAGNQSLWSAFNHVAINAGVTKVVTGRSGRSLLSFNEHTHLLADHVTYR